MTAKYKTCKLNRWKLWMDIIAVYCKNDQFHQRCCRWPATSRVHYTTNCNTQSCAPEDEQNNCPKHVELTGIINKPLSLHLVGCLYYLYQWCTVKQISDNETYLLIKFIKSILWNVARVGVYKKPSQFLCILLISLNSRHLKLKLSLT